jgi:FkbM family methyltransferase
MRRTLNPLIQSDELERGRPFAVAVAFGLLSSRDVLRRFLTRRFTGSRILHWINFSLRGTLNGRVVRIPVRAGIGLMDPPIWEQEPWLDATLAKLLDHADGAFVDVGVNLGQSLLKVKTLRPSIRYVGFEPNPICVAYVRDLVAVNRLQDVVIAPFGLSNRASTLSLFTRPDDDTDSSATVVPGLFKSQDSWTRTNVVVLKGDEALSSLQVGPVSVIKIDVEGAELEVVQGLADTLARYRPAILCEVLPTYSGADGRRAFREPRIQALVETIRSLDYRLFRLMPTGDVIPLRTIEPHGNSSLTNYAFVPSESARRLTTGTVAPVQVSTCVTDADRLADQV